MKVFKIEISSSPKKRRLTRSYQNLPLIYWRDAWTTTSNTGTRRPRTKNMKKGLIAEPTLIEENSVGVAKGRHGNVTGQQFHVRSLSTMTRGRVMRDMKRIQRDWSCVGMETYGAETSRKISVQKWRSLVYNREEWRDIVRVTKILKKYKTTSRRRNAASCIIF